MPGASATAQVILKSRNEIRPGTQAAGAEVKRFADGSIGQFARIGRSFLNLRNIIIGGFAAKLIRDLTLSGDEVDKLSQRIAVGTEEFQILRHAMELGGGSAGSLEAAFKGLSRKIYDAKNGLVEAQRAFDAVGVSSEELAGMTPYEMFRRLLQAVGAVEDPMLRLAMAQEFFGRGGQTLMPVINQMAGNLDELGATMRRNGQILSEEQIQKSADFRDALVNLNRALQGMAFDLLEEALGGMTEGLNGAVEAMGRMQEMDEFRDMAADIAMVVGGLRQVAGWLMTIRDLIPGGNALFAGALTNLRSIVDIIGGASEGVGPEAMAAWNPEQAPPTPKPRPGPGPDEDDDGGAGARAKARDQAVAEIAKDADSEVRRRAESKKDISEAEAELARALERDRADRAYAEAEAEARAGRTTAMAHVLAVQDYLDEAGVAAAAMRDAQDEISRDAAQATLDRATREAEAEAAAGSIRISAMLEQAAQIAGEAASARRKADAAWEALIHPESQPEETREDRAAARREKRIERRLPGLRERYTEVDEEGVYRDRFGKAATKSGQAILRADAQSKVADAKELQEIRIRDDAEAARSMLTASQQALAGINGTLSENTASLRDKIAELIGKLEGGDNPLAGMSDEQLGKIQTGANALVAAANEAATALRNALLTKLAGPMPAPFTPAEMAAHPDNPLAGGDMPEPARMPPPPTEAERQEQLDRILAPAEPGAPEPAPAGRAEPPGRPYVPIALPPPPETVGAPLAPEPRVETPPRFPEPGTLGVGDYYSRRPESGRLALDSGLRTPDSGLLPPPVLLPERPPVLLPPSEAAVGAPGSAELAGLLAELKAHTALLARIEAGGIA